MPQNDGEVRVEITGDSSKVKKELKETESAAQKAAKTVSDMVEVIKDTWEMLYGSSAPSDDWQPPDWWIPVPEPGAYEV